MEKYYAAIDKDTTQPLPDSIETGFAMKYIRVEYGSYSAADDSKNSINDDKEKRRAYNAAGKTRTGSNQQKALTLQESLVIKQINIIKKIIFAFPREVKICNQQGREIQDDFIAKITPRNYSRIFGAPERIQFGADDGPVTYVMMIPVHTKVGIRTILQADAVKQATPNSKTFMIEHQFPPSTTEISIVGFLVGLPPSIYSQKHVLNLVNKTLTVKKNCTARQASVYSKMIPLFPTNTEKKRGIVQVYAVETPVCNREKVRNTLERYITKVSKGKATFVSSLNFTCCAADPQKKKETQSALLSHASIQDSHSVVRVRKDLKAFRLVQQQILQVDGVVTIDNNEELQQAKGIFRIIIEHHSKIKSARSKIYKLCGIQKKYERRTYTMPSYSSDESSTSSDENSPTTSLSNWTRTINNWFAETTATNQEQTTMANNNNNSAPLPVPRIIQYSNKKQTLMANNNNSAPLPVPRIIQCSNNNSMTVSTTTTATHDPMMTDEQLVAIKALADIKRRLDALEKMAATLNNNNNNTPSNHQAQTMPAPPDYQTLLAAEQAKTVKLQEQIKELKAWIRDNLGKKDNNDNNEPKAGTDDETMTTANRKRKRAKGDSWGQRKRRLF